MSASSGPTPNRLRFWAFVASVFLVVMAVGVLRALTDDRHLTASERRMAAYVDDHKDEAVALLRRLVDTNSGTHNPEGVRQVGTILEEELKTLGFTTRWDDPADARSRGSHLFAEHPGTKGPRILLIGHLDTVFEAGDTFTAAEEADNTLHGPGAADMKGGDVVLLYALKAMASVGALDDTRITIAFTGDEEEPARPLSESRRSLIAAGQAADVALGFEPGIVEDGVHYVSIARRSVTNWTLEVRGTAGHSSRIFDDEHGAGAIFEAARILNGFYESLREEPLLSFNPGLMLAGSRADLGDARIDGTASGKTNVIAEKAVVRGDIRAISAEQLEEAKTRMHGIVGDQRAEDGAGASGPRPGTRAELSFEEGYPAMAPTAANRILLRAYADVSVGLGGEAVQEYDPGRRGAADISFVAPRVQASLAGLGPSGGGAHSREEFVDLPSLVTSAQRAALLIFRLTRGRIDFSGGAG